MKINKPMLLAVLMVSLIQGFCAQQPCDIRGFQYDCYGKVLDIEPETVSLGSTFTVTVKPGSNFDFTSPDLRVILQPTTATGWGLTAIRLTSVQVVDSKTLKVYVPPYTSYVGMRAYVSVFKFPSFEQAESDEILEIAQASEGPKQGRDYGDAPDNYTAYYTGVVGRFPTLENTRNSESGRPGAHTLNIGQEMIGSTVSAESDANDPADEDGVVNLVDMDKDDRIFIFMVATSIPASAALSFDVTVAGNAPDLTRYVNVLVDFNQDGRWGGDSNGKEWAVVNMPVNVKPGKTERVRTIWFAWGGGVAIVSPTWMRIALTREPVDVSLFPDGWDGSGEFEYGEIQDHWFAWDGISPPRNKTGNVSKQTNISCRQNTWNLWLRNTWKPGMVCIHDCPKDFICTNQCVCKPVKKNWHTECLDGRCRVVIGAGADQCKSNRDCWHYGCEDGLCNWVNWPGVDECKSYKDCRHRECTGLEKCETVMTPGEDECKANEECCHTECVGGECRKVEGKGEDECKADEECSHKVCVGLGKCETVLEPGEDECKVNEDCDKCPKTKGLYETLDACEAVCKDDMKHCIRYEDSGCFGCVDCPGESYREKAVCEANCDLERGRCEWNEHLCYECRILCSENTYVTETACEATCERDCSVTESKNCWYCPSCEELGIYSSESDCKEDCDEPDVCTYSKTYKCWYCQEVTCGGDYPYKSSDCDGECDEDEVCEEYQDSGCYGCEPAPCPDLYVSSISAELHKSYSITCQGEYCETLCELEAEVEFNIRNSGTASAGASTVRVDITSGVGSETESMESLNPGQTSSTKTSYLSKSGTVTGSGVEACATLEWWVDSYTVKVTADYGKSVSECNEGNNLKSVTTS